MYTIKFAVSDNIMSLSTFVQVEQITCRQDTVTTNVICNILICEPGGHLVGVVMI